MSDVISHMNPPAVKPEKDPTSSAGRGETMPALGKI
ncbi:MAG: hypothetical protein JWP91_594 [Fibrobacteres bacterium]|nr:hypothetical protein [Fibrobacterota bacterium]